MVKSFITKAPLELGYTLAGKTGTAELTDNDTKELAWFICWRDSKGGEKVTAENARLVCIMLEIDLTKEALEWSQMKFDIARALLKDDILNETEG
jgi:beta-lactamase class D